MKDWAIAFLQAVALVAVVILLVRLVVVWST